VVLGVDPFDEPNVSESKANTKRLLEEHEAHGAFSTEQSSKSANAQINKFLRGARPGDYISVQAYVPYNANVAVELARLRSAIGARSNLPVTVGYGPRFLHSTGQLHKGGANNAVAVQLTCDTDDDLPIPGEPYTFGTLIRAQALGDHEALLAHGRRVIRLHLGRDAVAGLKKVIQTLKGPARKPRAAGKSAPARKAANKGTKPGRAASKKTVRRSTAATSKSKGAATARKTGGTRTAKKKATR
jgi:transaldolase / glucose-6-phosphate isomerase